MMQEIEDFKEALAKLKEAEDKLNDALNPSLKAAWEARNVMALLELVAILPKQYKGTRRIFEALILIEDEKCDKKET